MGKFLVVMSLMLLISTAAGIRHVSYSQESSSDIGIYSYFSSIIDGTEKTLRLFLDEDKNAVNNSLKLLRSVETVRDEYIFYRSRGVESNVSEVVWPFLDLTEGANSLAEGQREFLRSLRYISENRYNQSAYSEARHALTKMKASVEDVSSAVELIENLSLWNGTSEMHFDVRELKSLVDDVEELIAYYESFLGRFEWEGIFVSVSNRNPVLFENITVSVYYRNVTPEYLVIDEKRFPIEKSRLTVSFNKTGEHVIFATGIKDGRYVESNKVRLNVGKIPTTLFLYSKESAFIKEVVPVSGSIIDYYGNPLSTTVFVSVNGNGTEIYAENGRFSLNVTSNLERVLKISALYPGDSVHASSEADIRIHFKRLPVLLFLQANRSAVGVNETVQFDVKVEGISTAIPLEVFINSVKVMEVDARQSAAFNISFKNPGRHSVFVYYPGNQTFSPSRSNTIEIEVASPQASAVGVPFGIGGGKNPAGKMPGGNTASSNYVFLLIVFTGILLGLVYLFYIKRKRAESVAQEHTSVMAGDEVSGEGGEPARKVSEKFKEVGDVREAYRMLFNELIRRYGLKMSMTPREMLYALKDREFADKLGRVTDIHEFVVYGKMNIDRASVEEYLGLIIEILEVPE